MASQLSFRSGYAHGRIRTCDTWLRRPVLYPLSYVGLVGCRRIDRAINDAPLYPFEPWGAPVGVGDHKDIEVSRHYHVGEDLPGLIAQLLPVVP